MKSPISACFAGWIATLCASQSLAALRLEQVLQVPASQQQTVADIKTDAIGNMVVCGTAGVLPSSRYGFVKKVDRNGTELFSQLLPGANLYMRLALDSKDDIYLTGTTSRAAEFPFTQVLVTSRSSSPATVFVVKLSGQDGTIVYATGLTFMLGGPGGLTIDSNGQALVAGSASGTDFMTTPGAYSSPSDAPENLQASLIRLSETGDRLVWAARYGGQRRATISSGPPRTEAVQPILDAEGNIWVAGSTLAPDLPVTADALKKTCGCGRFATDAYLAKFSTDGSRLLYATYIGGSTPRLDNGSDTDYVTAAAADPAGHLWLTGFTTSGDFPAAPNGIRQMVTGGLGYEGGFVLEYDPSTKKLLYSSTFGGPARFHIANIAIAPSGAVMFAGTLSSFFLSPGVLPILTTGFKHETAGPAVSLDFLATIDLDSYTLTLTSFPPGSTGAGLAFTANGLATVASPNNFIDVVQLRAEDSPGLYAIANVGASNASGQVAPGELISLYGVNLGPAQPAIADLSTGDAPTQLADIQVTVDGVPAALLYAQNDQVNAIVPSSVTVGTSTHLRVINAGIASEEAVLGVVEAQPNALRTGNGIAALNEDGKMNTCANPAQLGSIVSIYGSGFGPTVSPKYIQTLFRGQSLEITYVGPTPDLIPGVTQVDFRLPDSSPDSLPQFQFSVDGWLSETFPICVKSSR